MAATRQNTVFKALADPTRRAILDLVRDTERSVAEIALHFRVSRPAISQHLRALRRARLVVFRRDGRQHFYALRPEPLRLVSDWLETYGYFWAQNLARLKAFTEAESDESGVRGDGNAR
jgi:DNA-binding transcriptional ArsR family regulator